MPDPFDPIQFEVIRNALLRAGRCERPRTGCARPGRAELLVGQRL